MGQLRGGTTMRILSTLAAAAITGCTLSSCMVAGGNQQSGHWGIAALGTDMRQSNIGAGGWQVAEVNNSRASKELSETFLRVVKTKALFGLAREGVSAVQSVGNNAINSFQ